MSDALPQALADRCASLRAARDAQLPSQILSRLLSTESAPQPGNPSTLYQVSDLLNPRQLEIVQTDATGLAKAIASKQYTSVEVTEAFIITACCAHQGTNCLAWLFAGEALERARWLDGELERTGQVVGPMHGVPMSVKDFIAIKGIPQSSGHISSADYVPKEDAALIKIYRDAGAVFFAKTTQPQSIMHLETSSHIYGVTCCAQNSKLTCGGSSGGEGALVGCRGSPWGITTDVGGSTRCPAAFNGLWGFKPTTKRIPRAGLEGITSTSRVAGTIGPVCHSVADMELFFRVIFDAQPWKTDITLVNEPWRPVDESGKGLGYEGWSGAGGKLRVGVMRDDGMVRPVKPVRRAMDATVEALVSSGLAEIVEMEPMGFEEGWELTSALYYIDGGKKLQGVLGDEPMLPLTKHITANWKTHTADDTNEYIVRRNVLRQAFCTHMNTYNIDVLLLPAGPAPAQPLGTTKYWSYTSMFNLLDWPAAVLPSGLAVDAELDAEDFPAPRNEQERHLFATYSAEVAAGSMIGLQVVAPRWQDERLMASLKTFEKVLPLSGSQA